MGRRRDVSDEHERLQAEIQREKAEALGRAGERLEDVLRKLAELRHTIEDLRPSLKEASFERRSTLRSIRRVIQEHNTLRKHAMTLRRYLVIQREAVGFCDHRDVDRLYRIPGSIEEVES